MARFANARLLLLDSVVGLFVVIFHAQHFHSLSSLQSAGALFTVHAPPQHGQRHIMNSTQVAPNSAPHTPHPNRDDNAAAAERLADAAAEESAP